MIKVSFLILSILVSSMGSAWAYVPPSFYMVKKMTEKRSGYRTLKIVSTVKEVKDKEPTGLQFKQVLIFDEKSGVLRSWAFGESEKPLYYQERKLLPLQSGSVAPGPLSNFVLYEPQVVPVARALIQGGLPLRSELELNEMKDEEERRGSEVTALRRWNGIYSWTIGRDGGSPQIWLEKDSFLPLRLVLPHSDPAKDLEIQFNLHRSSGGFLYPYELVVLLHGVPRLKEEAVTITPNSKDSAGLPILSSTGLTPAGEDVDSRMKELLSVFYGYVR